MDEGAKQANEQRQRAYIENELANIKVGMMVIVVQLTRIADALEILALKAKREARMEYEEALDDIQQSDEQIAKAPSVAESYPWAVRRTQATKDRDSLLRDFPWLKDIAK